VRRFVLALTAVATLAEALLLGGVLFVLGRVIDGYSMSLGGIPPDRGRTGVWLLAAVLAGSLAGLSAALAAAAVRGRYGRPTRVALVAGAVLQWVLAVVLGIVAGWPAFVAVLAVFGCLVAVLMLEPPARTGAHRRLPA
jgi:hypothetical protein